ncbi:MULTISPECIES: VOC family protein [Oceanobacillus]|uniref:VOC family protein n=1 Tax=Oceanobacillus aidingensis TaxID=645964 RepID=A0ABV9JVV6_9BACI|nr:VOC family protein [Oceanobacillus oncorhynchi]MDM8102054.1 VOC family protein [Oceanobacillus oncorhynchi]
MTADTNKIVPHLWFDKEAKEAAAFYTSVFPDSQIISESVIPDTPSGDCDLVSFDLWGQRFMAISAGPYFSFNPSISFMVNFDPARDKNAAEQLEAAWEKLSDGGVPLMPLDSYPFSKKYGWIQDKYGLSWQLILTNPEGEERPPILPSMMFTGENAGRAEEAVQFYLSIFNNSKKGNMAYYPAGMEPNKEGAVMFSDFALENVWITAMDSGLEHGFQFNEAVSLLVNCDTQEEIDHYFEQLSAVPEAEQCGWLKDKFGVSWQISPSDLDEMMGQGATPEQIARVNQTMMPMKKLNIEILRKAYEGK